MPLTTTTIGAYPKPKQTPIQDWFLGTKSEEERKASKGLLSNWSPGAYEKALESAGADAEKLFLAAIKEVITDQVNAGIDVPTDGEVRRESYVLYQCRFLNGVSFKEVITDQVNAGIDVPTDGEVRRESYVLYQCRFLNGVSFKEVTHKSVRQGAFEADLPTIVAPISSKEIRMHLDWKSAQQFTKNPVKITLPGPMTITDSIANNYYDDMKKLGFDLALALNKEVKALVDAGCQYIQIDEPVFARKPDEAHSYGMENLERMMHGIPKEVQRVCHICCGYPNSLDSEGYKKADLDAYDRIASLVDDSTIDEVSLEDSHRHNDLNLLEKFTKTKVIFGFIDIAKSRMESVEEVRVRIKDSLEHIDEHRLIAAPDCGLGFFTREQAIEKMTILTKAAKSI